MFSASLIVFALNVLYLSELNYWTTRSSACSFACTAHSLACSALLPLIVFSTALTRLLAHSLTLELVG